MIIVAQTGNPVTGKQSSNMGHVCFVLFRFVCLFVVVVVCLIVLLVWDFVWVSFCFVFVLFVF